MPHRRGINDKIGKYAAQIANLKKCFYEFKRLDRYIQSVVDSQMRTILTLRYIQNLSWKKIAYTIDKYDEKYPRKKHNSFLKS